MPGATSAEVPVRQHQWSHQCPEVEQEPSPAGADLHPHSRPGARQHPQALIRPETANKWVAPITVLCRQGGIPLPVPSMASSNCAGEGWRLRAPSHGCNAKSMEESGGAPCLQPCSSPQLAQGMQPSAAAYSTPGLGPCSPHVPRDPELQQRMLQQGAGSLMLPKNN